MQNAIEEAKKCKKDVPIGCVIKKDGQIIALTSGANVVMLNITETIYKDKYEIYPNKFGSNCEIESSISELKSKLQRENIKFSLLSADAEH